MYWDIPGELLSIVEPIAKDHGLELVDASFSRGRGRGYMRLVVDTPQGDGRVKVDACAALSREVGRALDIAEFSAAPYMLEVCSPGVDRTLAREIDFSRAVGREIFVETRRPQAGRRRFSGTLVELTEGVLHLDVEGARFEIPLRSVANAHAVYRDGK